MLKTINNASNTLTLQLSKNKFQFKDDFLLLVLIYFHFFHFLQLTELIK
jgi:hypothetical protein